MATATGSRWMREAEEELTRLAEHGPDLIAAYRIGKYVAWATDDARGTEDWPTVDEQADAIFKRLQELDQ